MNLAISMFIAYIPFLWGMIRIILDEAAEDKTKTNHKQPRAEWYNWYDSEN